MITIFCEKFGFFLKNQCYDPFLQKILVFRTKNANFFAIFLAKKY
jgi:hypothetical protein